MTNQVNDFTNPSENSNSNYSLIEETSSLLFEDYAQQLFPQRTPEVNPFATPGTSDQSGTQLSVEDEVEHNPFSGPAPAEQSGSAEVEANPFLTPVPFDQLPFLPPTPGTSDLGDWQLSDNRTSDSTAFVPPTPGANNPQLSRDVKPPVGNVKPDQFLNVDANSLYKKPAPTNESLQQRVNEIAKLMKNNPELKDVYSDKLQALMKQKLTDADYLKLKEGVKKLPSDKNLDSQKQLKDSSEKLEKDKSLNADKDLSEKDIARIKAKATQLDDKNLENRKKVKTEGHDSGPIEDKTEYLKPLQKPTSPKEAAASEQSINGEDEALREYERSLQTADDETRYLKPQPDSIKEVAASEQSINGEDEALREYERSVQPADVGTATETADTDSSDSIDTTDSAPPDDADAPAPAAMANATGVGDKGEVLTAVLNGEKSFVARTNDGTSFVQRRDGAYILDSAEGRVKVLMDDRLTLTVNGVERQFSFDQANRQEVHPDGSVSHHFDTTVITDLRQGGVSRGIMIRQPNGTTMEASYAQPTELRYARGTGR